MEIDVLVDADLVVDTLQKHYGAARCLVHLRVPEPAGQVAVWALACAPGRGLEEAL